MTLFEDQMKKFFMCAVFCAAAFTFGICNAAAPSQIELETALQKLLQNRPEIILEVLRQNSEAVLDIAQQGSNLRRKHNLENQWREDMKKPKTVRLNDRPILGNPNAKVKIIAFSDFTCHFCEQASHNIETLRKEYGNDVSFVFKHYPLDEKGPGGLASAWFVAISQQNPAKAWEFYHTMYANRDKLLAEGEPFIRKTVQNLGLDVKKLARDAQNKKTREILSQDQEDGQKLGVEGTPYFLVNDLVVRGAVPLELFRAAVEMAKQQ